MFTSFTLDPQEVAARREAVRWMAEQLSWERRLAALRREESEKSEKSDESEDGNDIEETKERSAA